MGLKSEVVQQVDGSVEHGHGVGNIRRQGNSGVASAGLEYRSLPTTNTYENTFNK